MLMVALCISFATLTAQTAPEHAVRPLHYDMELAVDYEADRLIGTARIHVRNDADTASSWLPMKLYRLMEVSAVRDADGRPVSYTQGITAENDFSKLQYRSVRVSLHPALEPGATRVLELDWTGHLLGYAETGMRYVQDRIDEEYTLIRRDAFAYPVIPGSLWKFDFTLRVIVPDSLTVANGGDLLSREQGAQAQTIWHYRSRLPSWRIDIGIGPMDIRESGPVRIFYIREDSIGARAVLSAVQRSLEYYRDRLGALQGLEGLTFIEIPDGWGGQADVASVLQPAAAFRDESRHREVYHEIAHLWHVTMGGNDDPRWNEGHATYMEYRTSEVLDDRPGLLAERFATIRDWIVSRIESEDALSRVAMRDYGRHEMTGYSYSLAMLMFVVLEELVGRDTLDAAIGEFYRTYAGRGLTATTEDFVHMLRVHAGAVADPVLADWMYSTDWIVLARQGLSAQQMAARYRATP